MPKQSKIQSKEPSVGFDLVEVARFKDLAKAKTMSNVFTARELKDCQQKQNPAESLASRFAAKEAARKALQKNIKFNQIEIINQKNGSPQVNFLDKAIKEHYQSVVSLSHTKRVAGAVCILWQKKSKKK